MSEYYYYYMQRYVIHNFGEGKLKNLGELQKYNFIDVMGFESSQMENKEKLGENDRLGEGICFSHWSSIELPQLEFILLLHKFLLPLKILIQ